MRKSLLILKLIAGFAMTFVTKVHGPAPCNVAVVDNRLQANCSNKGILNVPQNLDEKIEVLDLSYNVIDDLNEKSFERYKALSVFIMKHSKPGKVVFPYQIIKENTFKPLGKLQYLDLTGSFLSDYPRPFWPPYLKILILNANDIRELDLGQVYDLEELYLNQNSLESFPILNREAPLKIIEIEDNPLYGLNMAHIIPFCQLKRFAIRFTMGGHIEQQGFFCDCIRLELWLVTSNTTTTNPLNCSVPILTEDTANKCSSVFSNQDLVDYQTCLARITTKKTQTPLLLLTILAVVAGLLVLTISAAIVYARRKARLEALRAEAAAASPTEEVAEEEIPEQDN